MFDTEKFIKVVHSRPCLWDVTSADYQNRFIKNNAWEEVGKEMHADWNNLSKEEKILRGSFIVFIAPSFFFLFFFFDRRDAIRYPAQMKRRARFLLMLYCYFDFFFSFRKNFRKKMEKHKRLFCPGIEITKN